MIWIFVNQKVENQLTHILAGSLAQANNFNVKKTYDKV